MAKVHEERLSVFGTAWYQLHHATIKLGVKRFHVVTWFGSMENRKFGGEPVIGGCTCPVCSAEMESGFFVGKEKIVKDLGSSAYRKVVLRSEFDENGEPNFR